MASIELLEEPISKSPVREKQPAGKKPILEKRPASPKSNLFLFAVLFLLPVITFSFAQLMVPEIRSQIGTALVWEQNADYWAGVYLEFGRFFSFALLMPWVISLF